MSKLQTYKMYMPFVPIYGYTIRDASTLAPYTYMTIYYVICI